MDCVGVSGVVRFLSFKAGGTKCDASDGLSVVLALWFCPLALGALGHTGAHWGSVGLAGLGGWLVGQTGLVRQGLDEEGPQLQASAAVQRRSSVESGSEVGLGLRWGALRIRERQRVAVHQERRGSRGILGHVRREDGPQYKDIGGVDVAIAGVRNGEEEEEEEKVVEGSKAGEALSTVCVCVCVIRIGGWIMIWLRSSLLPMTAVCG